MATVKHLARERNYDTVQWARLHKKHTTVYIRNRLDSLHLVVREGQTIQQAAAKLQVSSAIVNRWLKSFVAGGLEALTTPIQHHNTRKTLDKNKLIELERTILNDTPQQWGFERNIWTGELIIQMLKDRWGANLKKSRVYEILKQLKITHQRAHRDYDNADPERQKTFVETLKKNT